MLNRKKEEKNLGHVVWIAYQIIFGFSIMVTLASSLEALTYLLVPVSRTNQRLRDELLLQCQDILHRSVCF